MRMFVNKAFEQFLQIAEDIPAFFISIAVKNRDKIENLTPA